MKITYILLLSVSATMQAVASNVASPDTQSVSEVIDTEKIGVGRRHLQESKALELGSAHAFDSLLGEHAEIQARAAAGKTKPVKGTPAKGAPAKGQPAKGTPSKPTPAKPTPAKPTPTPKTSPKAKAGKCKRQVTVKSAGGQGKPTKGKPPGKGQAVRRTYTDFLKARNAQAAPAAFQTVAVGA